MKTYDIKLPKGFNPKTQKQVGLFVAQFDDQLKDLIKQVEGLTIKQLEWQLKPGMNTIGMLLAHLALVEYWWIKIAPHGILWNPEGKKMIEKMCGFEDDGIPLKKNGRHPDYLKSYSREKYVSILKKVRRSIKTELKSWSDRDLTKFYKAGRSRSMQFSRMWTLYHVLEHFASHFGQILLIKHMMVDAKVLKPKKK